jgi:HK97 family phage major capsid protein
MSDAAGRPILTSFPQELPGTPGFLLNGSPIQIVTQMPDVAPGATPVAFGNWNEVYMVVNRRAVTMQQDPYSAGFCILYKFEARVGGGIICPNAARLLRIR